MQYLYQMDELSLYVHPLTTFLELILSLTRADASEPFKAIAADNADFLTSLKPLVGDRNVSLENMYNVFDYMNVNYIHNAAFRASVTEQQMVGPSLLRLIEMLMIGPGRRSKPERWRTTTNRPSSPRPKRTGSEISRAKR